MNKHIKTKKKNSEEVREKKNFVCENEMPQ